MQAVRKMLGKKDSPHILSLMNLIGTQSKGTVARWCIDYARGELLPIYQKSYPRDGRGEAALDAADRWLSGELKLPVVKKLILEAHAAAREAQGNPAAQAAMRAVGQAASVVHVVTHALGIAFYSAAAIAYDRVGLEEKPEVYELIAVQECAKMEAALAAVAVPNEPHPVKASRHC